MYIYHGFSMVFYIYSTESQGNWFTSQDLAQGFPMISRLKNGWGSLRHFGSSLGIGQKGDRSTNSRTDVLNVYRIVGIIDSIDIHIIGIMIL